MLGVNRPMKVLSVALTQSSSLDAGVYGEQGDSIVIQPPPVAMFDQLLDWLYRQTPPAPSTFQPTWIGIGATALCLRWGTYLAVLLDEHKPLDPCAGSAEISMVTDSEMKRINLELSSNLARLIRMLHEDEAGCYRLLHLAQQHLAMPRLRVRLCAEALDAFRQLTSHDFWDLAGADLRARMDRVRPIVTQHPYRILGNSMTLAAWRNGPVESLHSGWVSSYTLNHRRATDQQSGELMRFTADRLAAVLSMFRPWRQRTDTSIPWPENLAGLYISPYYSPPTWSLTDTCSRIDLESQGDRVPISS